MRRLIVSIAGIGVTLALCATAVWLAASASTGHSSRAARVTQPVNVVPAPCATMRCTTNPRFSGRNRFVGRALSNAATVTTLASYRIASHLASNTRPRLPGLFGGCSGSVYRGPVRYEFHMAADGRVSCGGGTSYVSGWIELDEEWANGVWHRMAASSVRSCRAGGTCSGVTVGVKANCTAVWKSRLWKAGLHWYWVMSGVGSSDGYTYHEAHGCKD